MAAQASEKRPLGALGRMSLVAAIHIAVLFVIANGLGIVPSLKVPDPIVAEVLHESLPPPPDVVIREPDLSNKNQIELPLPDPLPTPPDASDNTIDAHLVPVGELPPTSGSAIPEPQIIGARLDSRRPLSQPTYPPELIRDSAQGSVDVEVFVQPDGRVSEARILKSSGYDAFDRNTMDEAKRKWRLVPATRDGVAIPQWYRLRVVFKLKNG